MLQENRTLWRPSNRFDSSSRSKATGEHFERLFDAPFSVFD